MDFHPGEDNHGNDGNSAKIRCAPAKPKICDKCGEFFSSMMKFNAHRGTCKKHKCSQCDLRFLTRKELKTHSKAASPINIVRINTDTEKLEVETE